MYLLNNDNEVCEMFIRLFAQSKDYDGAIKIFNEIVSDIGVLLKNQEFLKIEPYWKMDSIYLIEANIDFKEELKKEDLDCFFNRIANKWLFFGNPVNEALSSKNIKDCTYLKEGINMINIHY